jgi:C4-dicarboxylate-specific signal transduction histidine kinase
VKTSFALPTHSCISKYYSIGMTDPSSRQVNRPLIQPFFTTKPTGEGTGSGLSLSYDIVVKGHGGNITADSKKGEFTEFMVLLPN